MPMRWKNHSFFWNAMSSSMLERARLLGHDIMLKQKRRDAAHPASSFSGHRLRYRASSLVVASPKRSSFTPMRSMMRQVQAAQLAVVVAACRGSRATRPVLSVPPRPPAVHAPAASCCRASSRPTCSTGTAGSELSSTVPSPSGIASSLRGQVGELAAGGSARCARSRRTGRRATRAWWPSRTSRNG